MMTKKGKDSDLNHVIYGKNVLSMTVGNNSNVHVSFTCIIKCFLNAPHIMVKAARMKVVSVYQTCKEF